MAKSQKDKRQKDIKTKKRHLDTKTKRRKEKKTKSQRQHPSNTTISFLQTCLTLHRRPSTCFTPTLRPSWLVSTLILLAEHFQIKAHFYSLQITLVCVFCGCICVTTTIVLLIATLWDRTVTPYAKWVGFVAGIRSTICLSDFDIKCIIFSVIFFCLAAVTFPIGFSQEAIGGAPYQLPNSYQAGYILQFNIVKL